MKINFPEVALVSNSIIAGSCIAILVVLLRDFWKEVKRPGWYSHEKNKTVVALFFIFLSGGMARLWAVLLLQLRGHGYDTMVLEQAWPVPIYTGVVFIIGSSCLIRVWTKNDFEWTIGTLLILLFAFIMAVI